MHQMLAKNRIDRRRRMSETLVCPYCKREQYCHEDDEISALMCHTECESCGKEFWYSVDVVRSYYSRTEEDENGKDAE